MSPFEKVRFQIDESDYHESDLQRWAEGDLAGLQCPPETLARALAIALTLLMQSPWWEVLRVGWLAQADAESPDARHYGLLIQLGHCGEPPAEP